MTLRVDRVVIEFDAPSRQVGEQMQLGFSTYAARSLERDIKSGLRGKSLVSNKVEIDLGDLPLLGFEELVSQRIVAALRKLGRDEGADKAHAPSMLHRPDPLFIMLATGIRQTTDIGRIDQSNIAKQVLAMNTSDRDRFLQRVRQSPTAAKRLAQTTDWPDFAALVGITNADQLDADLTALQHRLGWSAHEFRDHTGRAILNLAAKDDLLGISQIEAQMARSFPDRASTDPAPETHDTQEPHDPVREFLSLLDLATARTSARSTLLNRLAELFAGLAAKQIEVLAHSLKSAVVRPIVATRLLDALPPASLHALLRALQPTTDPHAELLLGLAAALHNPASLLRKLLTAGLQSQPLTGTALFNSVLGPLLDTGEVHPDDLTHTIKALPHDQRSFATKAIAAAVGEHDQSQPALSKTPPTSAPDIPIALHQFLRYGLLGSKTVPNLRIQLSKFIETGGSTLSALINAHPFIRDRIAQLSEPSQRAALLTAVGADSGLPKLADTLQDMTAKAILLTPDAAFQTTTVAALATVSDPTAAHDPQRAMIRRVFHELLNQTQLLPEALATAMINHATPDLAKLLGAQARTAAALPRDPKDVALKTEPEDTIQMDLPETIYVDNAGSILLWPFLPQLLRALDLFKDGAFQSRAAQQNAVLLVHYLATGDASLEEHSLVMPKLLCGIPVHDVIEPGQELTPEQAEMCADLLHAMTQNWPGLENTSADGLRETFLNRSGLLKLQSEETVLHVESGPFDMLLDRLTWAISTISLSWMAHPLHVKWRDQ